MTEKITQSLQEDQGAQLATREQWQTDVATRQGIGGGPNANLREPMLLYREGEGPLAYLRQVHQGLGKHHRRLRERLPVLKMEFAAGVRRGIQEGYVPAYVADRIEPALEQTSVRLADPRVIDPQKKDIRATYDPTTDEIRLRPTSPARPGMDLLDFNHEVYHKISGGTFTGDHKGILRLRAGYNNYESTEGTKPGHPNIDEAIVHHLALSNIVGGFGELDPDRRTDVNTGHYTRRKVLAAFVDRARGTVHVQSLTNGFFEDAGPGGSTELRRRLVRETVRAYGWGALRKLEALCEYAGQVPAGELQQEVLDRIQPPQLDEAGNIVRQGNIDIPGPHLPMPISQS